MALQSSGQISIGDLKTEFGDTGSSSLSEFYRGGSLVPNTGTNAGVPTSGEIKLSDFYGASAVVSSWAWVTTYSSMNEGVTRTFQFEDTNDLITSGTFTWSINGTVADFSAVSGSGTISATSQGSFSVTTLSDATTEGNESYTITVSYGGSTILTQGLTVVDTSLTPVTIDVVRSTTSVNEGNSFTFYATASAAISGTVSFSLGGTATGGGVDYSTSGASGTFTFSGSTTSDSVTISTVADSTTEGSETVSCTISGPSVSGFDPSIGTSSTSVTINDTSVTPPTYAFSAGSYNVTEGNSSTITVNTTNVPNGTTLYWSLASDPGNDIDTDSGSFTINSNTGSFSVSATFDCNYSETTETLTLQLRTGSASGTIQDTADLNIINVGAPTVSSGTTSYYTDISGSISGAELSAVGRTYVSISASSSTITATLDGADLGDGSFTASTTNSGNSVTAYTVSAPGNNLTHYKLVATGGSWFSTGAGYSVNSSGGSISDNTWYSISSSGDAYIEVTAEVYAESSPQTEEATYSADFDIYYRDSCNNEVNAGSMTVTVHIYVAN